MRRAYYLSVVKKAWPHKPGSIGDQIGSDPFFFPKAVCVYTLRPEKGGSVAVGATDGSGVVAKEEPHSSQVQGFLKRVGFLLGLGTSGRLEK